MFTDQVNTAISRTAMVVILATQVHGARPSKPEIPDSFLISDLTREKEGYGWKKLEDGRHKWQLREPKQNADDNLPDEKESSISSELFKDQVPDKNVRRVIGEFAVPGPKQLDLEAYTKMHDKWVENTEVKDLCDLMPYSDRYERGPLKPKGYCRVLVQVKRKEILDKKTVDAWYAEWKLGYYKTVKCDDKLFIDVCWHDLLPWGSHEKTTAVKHPQNRLQAQCDHIRRYPFDAWFIHWYCYDPEDLMKIIAAIKKDAEGDEEANRQRRKAVKDAMAEHPIHSPRVTKCFVDGEFVGEGVVDGNIVEEGKYDYPDKKVVRNFHSWMKTEKWPELPMKWWQRGLCVLGGLACCPCVTCLILAALD